MAWPDEVRKALPQMNPLHYVDVPRSATTYDRERDCPQRNCIVEAVTWYLNVLKSTDSPLAEKHTALDYLVHLVGDLPVPLHVGFLDDLGGTKTKVTFQGKTQTLHELWGLTPEFLAERFNNKSSDSPSPLLYRSSVEAVKTV